MPFAYQKRPAATRPKTARENGSNSVADNELLGRRRLASLLFVQKWESKDQVGENPEDTPEKNQAQPQKTLPFGGLRNAFSKSLVSLGGSGKEEAVSSHLKDAEDGSRNFFGTGTKLKSKTWFGKSGYKNVMRWELDPALYLWTDDRARSRMLVITAHGEHTPFSGTVGVPANTRLGFYTPHGYLLENPKIENTATGRIAPLSTVASSGISHTANPVHTYKIKGRKNGIATTSPLTMNDKLAAGTSQGGKVKNYSLSKFKEETYSNIQDTIAGETGRKADIMTIRDRAENIFTGVSLREIFKILAGKGIQYDEIRLSICRTGMMQGEANSSAVAPARRE